MNYDLIIKNANIITMDSKCSALSGWIGINNGKITTVSSDACLASADKVIDADGATVLPGLTDSHLHVMSAGLTLTGVKLGKCTCIDDVLEQMGNRCKSTDGNGWVLGFDFVSNQLKENRYPTKYELDKISYGHKIAVCAATMHGFALNSVADEAVAIPPDMPGVEKIDGTPIGVYTSDESSTIVSARVFGNLSDDEIWDAIMACVNHGSSKGTTTMHGLFGLTVENDRDFKVMFDRKDLLNTLDMKIWYQCWEPKKVKAYGLDRVGGCLTLDGATFEYTQANYEPFVTAPHLRGSLYYTDDTVYRFISEAYALDLQTTMHAVGERAIDQLLYTYLRVITEQGKKDLRPRLEHFCLSTDKQIKLAKELGITLSMQPGFSYYWGQLGGPFEQVLGKERCEHLDAFSRVINAGVTLLGGSDCPVTPIEPLLQIAALVRNPNPSRNISMTDALKAYTVNPAYSTKEENVKGSIEEGKIADLVIIDKDPYKYVNSDELFNMNVISTIKSGYVVYTA